MEIKTKRVKRKEVDPDGERIRKVKSAKRGEQGTGKRAGMKIRDAFTNKKNASCGHLFSFEADFSPLKCYIMMLPLYFSSGWVAQ